MCALSDANLLPNRRKGEAAVMVPKIRLRLPSDRL